MFFIVHMHKHKPESRSVCPSDLGDFHRQGLIGRRKLDLERQARSRRKRGLAHDMAAFLRQAGDQPASVHGLAGKRQRHLDFITGTIAALHMVLSSQGAVRPTRAESRNGYAVRVSKSTAIPTAASAPVSGRIRRRICFDLRCPHRFGHTGRLTGHPIGSGLVSIGHSPIQTGTGVAASYA